MGTHPIFESDFDCLTEKGFKKKCLLINQFGLSSFLLRNKSKTDQFRNGFDSYWQYDQVQHQETTLATIQDWCLNISTTLLDLSIFLDPSCPSIFCFCFLTVLC